MYRYLQCCTTLTECNSTSFLILDSWYAWADGRNAGDERGPVKY